MSVTNHLSTKDTQSVIGTTTQHELTIFDGSERILLDLGKQPLANRLYATREESLEAERYRLCALYNEDDYLIHLDTAVDPAVLYKDYVYNSGVSKPYQDHCKEIFERLSHLRHDICLDIGGNDGTLLKTFKRCVEERQENKSYLGHPLTPARYINVDASESFKETNEEAGIEYVNAFFSDELDLPKANIITSTNVFQHTKDIHKFLRGIVKFLDGVWILEFPYSLRTLQTLQFDQFYHEHFYYWLITPLAKLFKEYGLKIIHYKEVAIHGGSIQLWMTNSDLVGGIDTALEKLLREEAQLNYPGFYNEVQDKILGDTQFLRHLKGRTAFFGAAAKGVVYLNALGLDHQTIPGAYVVDDTPSKQGKFIGGTGLEIKDRQFLYEDQPDNLIVLAHNFKDFIESSLRPHYRGRIITMFPEIEIKEFQS